MSPKAFLAITLASLLLTAQAAAPPRADNVWTLAFTLGQSHALRQLCQGESDQYWRVRMTTLIKIEAQDEAARSTMTQRFNDGFRSARAQQNRCSTLSRLAERAAAARGRALAEALAEK